jgi:putative DNA primase/helicase
MGVFRRTRFASTDIGNAERLCSRFIGDFRFVPAWGRYIVWGGKKEGRWIDDHHDVRIQALAKATIRQMLADAKPDDKDDAKAKKAKRSLKSWARASSELSRIRAMATLARSEPGVAINHEELDDKPLLLNVKNGTLVLDPKTGPRLEPQRPSDKLTRITKTAYDPKAKPPKMWLQFLEQVQPDDQIRELLQRYVGYSLTGEVGERTFLLIHGPKGRNGKSLFINVLQELLGPYATTAAPGILTARKDDAHPAELADLFGSRLVVTSEVRKGQTFDEEKTKRLTGNDRVKCRRMREDWWSYRPTFKLIVIVNHKLKVKDASDAFWDRILLVPFTYRVPPEKENKRLFAQIIATELPGILNWALEGLAKWRAAGLNKPKAVVESTKAYRLEEDVIGQFADERLDFTDPGGRVSNEDLVRASESWGGRNGATLYFSDLREFLAQRDECVSGRWDHNSKRGWHGVKLRPLDGAKEASDRENDSKNDSKVDRPSGARAGAPDGSRLRLVSDRTPSKLSKPSKKR